MTINYRGFTQISKNIYWDNACSLDKSPTLLEMISQAKDRVEEFWGTTENEAVIVLSDNPKNLQKLGLNPNSVLNSLFVFNGAHSYIAVNTNNVSVDTLAHELSHAELHSRIYKNKYATKQLVPTWFDEGLAMQVDYREAYNEDAYLQLIAEQPLQDQSNYQGDLSNIASTAQFFDENDQIRKNNYIISRHEVSQWLLVNGLDGLFSLIEGIQNGAAFTALY